MAESLRLFERAHSSAKQAGVTEVERARSLYERRAWASAHEAFGVAERAGTLAGEDLERFAVSAYLVGRDAEYLELLRRAYEVYLAVGSGANAARTAFWLGLRLLFRGELGHASGWFGRAQRLLEREKDERVERGYLLIADAQQQINAQDVEAARESAERAASTS